MTALLFALAIYVLALGTIGIVSNRKSKKTSADFFVASRGLGSFVMLMTMFATTMSAFSLLGVPQSGYLDGMGMLAGIGFGDAFIGFWIFLFGYRIWKAGRANGFITPTEFYRHRFNSDFVGICYMVNAFIFVFPFIGIQTIGGGNALAVATNGLITKEMAMIITVAVIIVYTILGGIKASAWADTMQSCIMVVSCLVVFVLSATYFKDGGFASATNQVIAAGNESLLTLPGPKGLWNWKYMVSYALMGGMSAPLWPQVFSRYYMNKNSASMKKMALLWPLMCLVLFLPMVLVGVWGTVIMPGVSNPDQILPLIVTKLFPPFVGAFIIVGIFAALMSTAASQLVALSTMVSRDIYLKYIDKNADDRKQILVGRISIIVIGCATLILGLKPLPLSPPWPVGSLLEI